MPVAAGQRTYEVTIQYAADSVGTSRFPVETFTDTAPAVWMSREAAQTFDRGVEAVAVGQISARGYHRWTMPYIASMDPDLVDVPKLRRLKYQSRVYDIIEAQRAGLSEIVLTTLVKSA